MLTSNLNLVLAATLLGTSLTTALAQKPTPLLTQPADQLIAVLKSDASQKEKVDACRQLAVVGTAAAVPALAGLLPDEKLNHMARFALEAIPDSSVDKTLRDALGTLKGRPLVGVIGSIGVRKDSKAVPDLTKLLTHADADVVQAAARALGRIGDWDAARALQRTVEDASAVNQLAFCEGLFRCAETLQSSGERKQAMAIYDKLRELRAPEHVRVGALRGAILVRGGNGVSLLRDGLRNKDYVLFAAAVRTTYEMAEPQVTAALAAELPQMPDDDHKILVIQALGRRTDAAAVSALSTAAQTGPKPVRLAAVRALGETGSHAASPALSELLVSNERDVSRAALEGFAALRGPEIDSAVQSMLKSHDANRRLAGVELVGRRRMAACVPDLLRAAADADAQVRPAALSQVGELGSPSDVPALLNLVPKMQTTQDLDAAEQALSTLCAKAQGPEASTDKITAQLAQVQPAQKGALLRVLSSIGGPSALKAVGAAVHDSNTEVHDAAIRALGAWKTADAAPDLLSLARNASNPTDQMLCLRSYLGLAANADVPADQRLAMCRDAASLAKGDEEKKLLLSALGSINTAEAVDMIVPYLDNAGTREEASAAVAAIADKMLKGQRNKQAASKLIQPLEKVAQATANEELSKRAKTLLQRAQSNAAN